MGSDYTLLEDDKVLISIDEISNRLSLLLWDKALDPMTETNSLASYDMEPKDMLKLLLKGLTACSYYISKEEFDKEFDKLEVFPY